MLTSKLRLKTNALAHIHYYEYVEVIDHLEEILSSHGLPVTTKSDSGP